MRHNNAFSLVELSIVLVILGLLVGGILAGQSLIRAAELRAVSSEFQRYATSVFTFRDKYIAVPGDMANATQFWGVNGNATDCKTTASTTQATCDGNGDAKVDESPIAPFVDAYERFTFWKHLANAGLVEGTYTGVAGPGGVRDVVAGTNSPRSRISSAAWSAAYGHGVVSDLSADWYNYSPGNMLIYGGDAGAAANWGLVLKPEEAWNIDTKTDDGKPAYGRVLALKPSPSTVMPNCTTNVSSSAAEYNLTYPLAGCALVKMLR